MVVFTTAPLMAADLWIHLRVEETRWDGHPKTVNVNFPLSAIQHALPLIPKESGDRCEIHTRNGHVEGADLRRAVEAVRNQPEGTVVTLDDDASVTRRGEWIEITGRSHHDGPATITMPWALAAALTSAPGDHVNPQAAAAEMIRRGAGQLLTVRSEDATVRIWIDDAMTATAPAIASGAKESQP